jgi:hypothetical protein
MKSLPTLIATAAVAALLLAPLAVRAQAEKPAAAPAAEAKPADAAPRRSRSNVDARKCLELATNIEIHKCAEQYR